jgi:phosphoglycerate dehydrogenase-like enzyme
MIGAAKFACMKSTALFINAARGGLIDETALAGTDTSEEEPQRSAIHSLPRTESFSAGVGPKSGCGAEIP